ncbi:MAG: TatD family hydrolase [Bifidobacteriaceae bacterium]|jgi:TatD DNase family protein|nr:TatD family hydrolase [Bifidobacteriaceae bacterium]
MSTKSDKKRRNWGEIPTKLPSPIIDTHAHIDMIDDWVKDINQNNLIKARRPINNPSFKEIAKTSLKSNINNFIQCACDYKKINNLSNVLDSIGEIISSPIAAVAIHPNEAALHDGLADISPDGLTPRLQAIHKQYNLPQAIEVVRQKITNDNRIRVVGETGLDFYRTAETGWESQIKSFRQHIEIAKQYNLALQIHDRLAHKKILEILQADIPPERVIFHSFSGDSTMAEFCCKQGWYLSYSGPITFKNNHNSQAALKSTNLNYLLLETDCPFLAPEPNRGRPNAPVYTANVATFISNFLDLDLTEFCQKTYNNTLQVLDL